MTYHAMTMSETIPTNGMDVDRVFTVLSDERRRLILEYLLEGPSPATVSELVDHLVTAELNGHEHPDDLRDRIAVSLHHVHLPKLADSNLVDFDPEREEIDAREAVSAVEPCLALGRVEDRPGE